MSDKNFRKKLEKLLNQESMELNSNTPDYILVNFIMGCLETFAKTMEERDTYFEEYSEMFEENHRIPSHFVAEEPDDE